jgi:hypothetical protein
MAIVMKDTKYGPVFRSTQCKDDHSNIVDASIGGERAIGGTETYKLQKPAVESLRAVADVMGRRFPWRRVKRPVKVTGTWRACAYQAQLYFSDPKRYAHPNTTLHTQGLAIDVDTHWLGSLTAFQLRRFRRAMAENGWSQSRPDDEPWHWSYGWTA